MRRKSSLTICLIFLLLCILGHAADEIPVKLQVAIFFKILSYDNNLPAYSPDKAVLVVITDSATQGKKKELIEGFKSIANREVQGKSLVIVPVDFVSAAKLATDVAAQKGTILYVSHQAQESTINAALSLARSKKIPILGDSGELAERGFSVGLNIEGGKPKIVVNLKASKEQRMSISAKVLGLAKVIH